MPARFDVFLSHATPDKPLVEELARRLERENLKSWLDTWNLIPGTAWMPKVEEALAQCTACAVFVGPGSHGPWQLEEMRAAITRRVEEGRNGAPADQKPFRVVPVLLPGVDRPERSKLPAFLVATTWVEFRESLDDPEAFRRLVCGIRGIEPGPNGPIFDGRCPYRGLELFDIEHASLFFGREALTEWLLDALKRKPSGAENRFLAIVGASGSGKSSLARAGLMASLKDGQIDGSASWPRAICRPGAEPFRSLATALTTLAPESVAAVVFDRLQGRKDGECSLHVAAELVLGEPPRAERLVLLVDQFEEVFTTCTDQTERRDLITSLLHATTVAGGRTIVVLTMRADFYPRCAAYADLAAALSDHQVLVGPMTDDELRRAIERPARLAGLEPEPGLVELLLDDVRGRPGALPLLQFTLQELWRRREAHRLTIRAYRDLGEIEGTLQRKADAVYAGFTPAQQELCRRIFLRLVQPGEGSEDTRRRASLREVLPDDPAQAEAVRSIIARLSDPESRLLTTERERPDAGEGTLEVAHEALIRGWPQLRTWIEADRAGLRTHRRLTEAAREWADATPEAKEGSLYAGARLAVATEWAASHRAESSALEMAFLSASREHERKRRADEAEQNRRLAEAERQRAEEAEARKREAEAAAGHQKKLSRRFLIAAAVSLLLAIAAGLQTSRASKAREAAEKSARLAQERATEAREQTYLANRRHYGVNMVMVQRAYDDADMSLFRRLLSEQRGTYAGTDHRGFEWRYWARRDRASATVWRQPFWITCTSFSADGEWLAVGSPDHSVTIRSVRDGTVRRTLKADEPIFSVSFSPDGRWCAAASGGDLEIWGTADGASHRKLPYHSAVRFLPDGSFAARNTSGVAVYQTVDAEKPVRNLATQICENLAVSRDGKRLATAGNDPATGRETVQVWDIADGRLVASLTGDPRPEVAGLSFAKRGVSGVALSADGQLCAVSGAKTIRIWDAAAQKVRHVIDTGAEPDWEVAFEPDGRRLATGGGNADDVIKLYDLETGRLVRRLIGHESHIGGFSFSPDGRRLASGDSQGEIRLWDLQADDVLTIQFKPTDPTAGASDQDLAFGGDGRWLIVSGGSSVVLCDPSRGTIGPVLEGAAHPIALAHDGVTLITADRDDYAGLRVWDLSRPDPPRCTSLADRSPYARDAAPPATPGTGVPSIGGLALDPDGRWIAVGRRSGKSVGPHGIVYEEGLGGGPVRRLDREGGGVSWTVFPHRDDVTVLAGSPDGRRLASGSMNEGIVKILDAATGREVSTLKAHDGLCEARFSPDGRWLATGGFNDKLAILWEVSSGREVLRFRRHTGPVLALAFSPNGQRLATGGSDGRVEIWDVITGQNVLSLAAHTGRIGALAFSPGGHRLASLGREDHALKIWDARPLEP